MPFSNDFLWGAASAAYQVEGAWNEDGKAPSIWDALSPVHVKHHETGEVACDHYHRYKEDVALMKEIGLKAYRFSVSWPRVISAEGTLNPKGLAFYRSLVSELRAAGIEPVCTLYHWDLPMWVHEKGGWLFSGVSDLFEAYTREVVDALSDQVQYWITVNEPACFTALGYIVGMNAPFQSCLQDRGQMMQTIPALVKNVLLSHGKAVRVIREHAKLPPKIGLALAADIYTPTELMDEKTAREKTFSLEKMVFSVQMWMDPILKGKLPGLLLSSVSDDELKLIHQPLDFFGYNCYNSSSYSENRGEQNPNRYPGMPITATEWPITPDVLYWASKFFYEEYRLPILITENGMANNDFVMRDGKVHDPQRIDFMEAYLRGLKRALCEGIPVLGYFYWSFMDNMEWAEGYDKRFGLVYNDYRTQKRTLKDSAVFYKQVIDTNGACI